MDNQYNQNQNQYNNSMQYGRNGQEQYQQKNQGQYYQTRQPENPAQSQYQQYTGQNTSQNINYQTNNNQNNMIKNPKTNIEINKNPEMNERDYLNDILATEKYLTDGYNTFLREASHTELYTDIQQILNETHDCAREAFNLMFENGFYSFQSASPQEIQKAQDTYSNYLNQQSPYNNQTEY